MMEVIRFLGASGSGKTTLIGAVVGALTKAGLRVATYKHAHHDLQFDERKDSSRLAAAGSHFVLAASGTRVVTFRSVEIEPTLDWLVGLAPEEVDVILAEGFHDAAGPYFSLVGPDAARDDRPTQGVHLGEVALPAQRSGGVHDDVVQHVAQQILDWLAKG